MPRRIHSRAEKASRVDPRFTGGNFVSPSQKIDSSLPYIVFVNADVIPWTVVLYLKAGDATLTYTLNPGQKDSWPTHPFNRVTAALPTGGTATMFQSFYSHLQVNGPPIGTSNGGAYEVVIDVSLSNSGDVTIFTVPPGKRARFLRGAVFSAGGTTVTLWIQPASTLGFVYTQDYITPKAGSAIGAGDILDIGSMPGNDIVTPVDSPYMLPGDLVRGIVSTFDGGSVEMAILLEPL